MKNLSKFWKVVDFFLVFVVFFLSNAVSQNSDHFRSNIHRSLLPDEVSLINGDNLPLNSLPSLSEIDSIELYQLTSFRKQLISISTGATFALQTSGLALRSVLTGQVAILDYKPVSYDASYLPRLQPVTSQSPGNSNIASSMQWDERAIVRYADQLDLSQWQHSTYLGSFNAVVYNLYVSWVKQYASDDGNMSSNTIENEPKRNQAGVFENDDNGISKSVFMPHNICSGGSSSLGRDVSSGERIDKDSCFVTAHNGEQFVMDTLQILAGWRVSLHALLPPRAMSLYILANVQPRVARAVASTSVRAGSLLARLLTPEILHEPETPCSRYLRNSPVTILDVASLTKPSQQDQLSTIDSRRAAEVENIIFVSDSDIYDYYTQLLRCMERYSTEGKCS